MRFDSAMKKNMKKIISVILILASILAAVVALSSCTDKNGNNYSEIGLSFYLPTGFEKMSIQNYSHAYRNGEAEFLINAMSYEQLESNETTSGEYKDSWPTDLYSYVRRFAIENNISLSKYTFDHDKQRGEIKYVYEYEGEDADIESDYCHYVFLDNGEAIYFITYTCKVSYMEKYQPLFDEWSSKLVLKKVK